jgi:hypothetical protein
MSGKPTNQDVGKLTSVKLWKRPKRTMLSFLEKAGGSLNGYDMRLTELYADAVIKAEIK